jgi:hypothetical protein
MKKGIILFLCFGILISCGKNAKKNKPEFENRTEILNGKFSNSEIVSIEIIEIEHPMLGGIVKTVKLNKLQKEKFLSDLDNLKKKGMLKCGAKYVVRLNMEKDTLRLKICENNIASRKKDFYYELENGKNIIEEYIKTE